MKIFILIGLLAVAIGVGATFGIISVIHSNNADHQANLNAARTARIAARSACVAEHKDTTTLSNLLIYIETKSLQSPGISSAQKTTITQFYTNALATLPSVKTPC